MNTEPNDRTLVHCRTVVNDAMVHPWEPMPEVQPPTLTVLIDHLRTCHEDPEGLTLERLRNGDTIANLGIHMQFFLPVEPTEAEIQRIEAWSKPAEHEACPICGGPLERCELYLNTQQSHAFECVACAIVFSRARRIAHSSQIMKRTLNEAVQRAAAASSTDPSLASSPPVAQANSSQAGLAKRLVALAERCGADIRNPSNTPIQFSPPSLVAFADALIHSPELREVAMLHAAQSFLENKAQPIRPIDTDPVGWGRSMLDWGDRGVKPEATPTFLLAVGEATLRVTALQNEKAKLIQRLETRNQAMEMSGKLNRRLLDVIEEICSTERQAADAGPDDAEKVRLRARIQELERLIREPVLAGMHMQAQARVMGLSPVLAETLVGMFLQMLDTVDDRVTSANYLEMRCHAQHQGEILVTVQRLEGKTPNALQKQAEADKAILVKVLEAQGIALPFFPEVAPCTSASAASNAGPGDQPALT